MLDFSSGRKAVVADRCLLPRHPIAEADVLSTAGAVRSQGIGNYPFCAPPNIFKQGGMQLLNPEMMVAAVVAHPMCDVIILQLAKRSH